MQASKIGGGNATDSATESGGSNAYHSRRTSFNMLCDAKVLTSHPKLDKHVSDLQVRDSILLEIPWRVNHAILIKRETENFLRPFQLRLNNFPYTNAQSRGRVLLQAKRWKAWGKPGFLPAPGQYTYESSQVTR